MSEAFALFASHPVAVIASLLAMGMWATVVWVGRGLMSKLDTATAALVAIPEAIQTENQATRDQIKGEHEEARAQIEAEHDKTRGRIHDQNRELSGWRRQQEVDMARLQAKLNGGRPAA